MDNLTVKSVMECFEEIRKANPEGIILLLIDNYPSYKTDVVLQKAKKLGIESCFLPTYFPQF